MKVGIIFGAEKNLDFQTQQFDYNFTQARAAE